jgi:hypothetical protein
MALSRVRFGPSTINDYELIRYCVKQNYSVRGGFSKMLKHIINDLLLNKIITFADRRYSDGDVYKYNGFDFVTNTNPAYHYFKTNNCLELFNRQKFQKHKLHKILEFFDPLLSEWQNMQAHGYDRIWDCGNTKWVYNI